MRPHEIGSSGSAGSSLAGVLLNDARSDREESAMMIWSERRGPRLREMVADAATIVWVSLWAVLGVRLYLGLAELAAAGRLIRDGGINLISGGGQVAGAVEGVPLVGEGAADRIRDAFTAAGQPVVDFGSDLERLLLIVAGLLGLIVVVIAVAPWLNRYVPWRVAQFQQLNAELAEQAFPLPQQDQQQMDEHRQRHEAVLPACHLGRRRPMPDLGRVLGAQLLAVRCIRASARNCSVVPA